MYICFGFRHAKCLWKKQEHEKNKNNVSFRIVGCQRKIALDRVKQVRRLYAKLLQQKRDTVVKAGAELGAAGTQHRLDPTPLKPKAAEFLSTGVNWWEESTGGH